MHIINIMFSAIGGGIEQAFVDYSEGLMRRGHKVTAITHPNAVVNPQLKALGLTPVTMRNIGEWDPVAIVRLGMKIKRLAPDVVLAHTGRSFALAKYAVRGRYPLVGVAHNYNARKRRMVAADGVFAITHDVMRFLMEQGIAEECIFLIPNMIKCDALPVRNKRGEVPIIGTMGRFVKKKGFEIYIDALKLLNERGYHFKAILGGDGEESARLKARAKAAGLADIVFFPGWIEDKKAFYTGIDMFCLPSLHARHTDCHQRQRRPARYRDTEFRCAAGEERECARIGRCYGTTARRSQFSGDARHQRFCESEDGLFAGKRIGAD